MNKKTLFLLLGILLLATFLRFYKLATLPPSLEWDEVATGYDAYSILKTGRDQYGKLFPITMRSLDDYKPPLYTYLTVGAIALLGWNDFAIRFPAALLGVLAVLSTYLLVKKMFQNETVALVSSLFLAISPWHVNFSRLALETNSTIFFTTAAVWAFFVGLKNGKYFILSALLFGADLYLYHNARVFVPLLGMALVVLYWKEIWQQKKYAIISVLLFSLFVIRLIPIVTSVEGQMRFQGTSIFSPAVPIDTAMRKEKYLEWRTDDASLGIGLLGRIMHSEKILFGLTIIRNYISHFDPTFWLFTDDQLRHHVPELGILYLLDLPLVYIGVYFLVSQKRKREAALIICWALFAPIAASVTRDVPHALRSELMLPTFQIAATFGLLGLLKIPRQLFIKRSILIFLVTGYAVNAFLFMHLYFVHYAKDSSKEWVYGRQEVALFAESQKQNFDRILVSSHLDQAHAFFLYYLRYDPAQYQKEGGTISGGWAEDRNHFDKYYFQPIDYNKMKDGKTLFIGLPKEFPQGIQVLKKIYYLDGEEAMWVVAG